MNTCLVDSKHVVRDQSQSIQSLPSLLAWLHLLAIRLALFLHPPGTNKYLMGSMDLVLGKAVPDPAHPLVGLVRYAEL